MEWNGGMERESRRGGESSGPSWSEYVICKFIQENDPELTTFPSPTHASSDAPLAARYYRAVPCARLWTPPLRLRLQRRTGPQKQWVA